MKSRMCVFYEKGMRNRDAFFGKGEKKEFCPKVK